jgi:serine/threonine protein kinase
MTGTETKPGLCAQKVDMWACGVILYTMLYGKYPFPDDDPLEQRRRMIEKKFDTPELVCIAAHLQGHTLIVLPSTYFYIDSGSNMERMFMTALVVHGTMCIGKLSSCLSSPFMLPL